MRASQVDIDLSGAIAVPRGPDRDVGEAVTIDVARGSDFGPEIIVRRFAAHGPTRARREGTALEKKRERKQEKDRR